MSIPTEKFGQRVYGKWSGNPQGSKEAKHRCVVEVQARGTWAATQCRRLRGKGPNGEYCKQHAKMVLKK